MKKRKHQKKAPRKNPFFAKAKPSAYRKHGRRRRNPNRTLLSKPVGMLKLGLFAGGGLVATRQLPQILLKEKNTGLVGYLTNLGVALGVAAGVARFAGKENGFAAGIGGAMYLVNRVISENFSPIPKALALSGLGDASAAGSLGAVLPTYLPYPVQYDNAGNPVIPAAIRAAAREEASAMLPKAGTVSGLPGRRAA